MSNDKGIGEATLGYPQNNSYAGALRQKMVHGVRCSNLHGPGEMMSDQGDNRIDRLWTEHKLLAQAVDNQGRALDDIGANVKKLTELMSSLPKNQSYDYFLKIAGGTASLVMALMIGLNVWLNTSVAPDRQTLSRIEKEAADIAVLRYRLQQIEARATR